VNGLTGHQRPTQTSTEVSETKMKVLKHNRGDAAIAGRGHRRRTVLLFAIAAAVLEAVPLKRSGYRIVGGNVVVRCRQGHLFTTIWIPAASVKSLRLGWWRLQRCPVGGHWSIVTLVRQADLSEDDRRFAREHEDIRIP
jgi:hypothetical protein